MTSEEKRKVLLNNMTAEWKSFILRKKEAKDIRFLLTPHQNFLDIIGEFSFMSLNWLEDPFQIENPRYEIYLHKNYTDMDRLIGEWNLWLKFSAKNIFVSPDYEGFVEFDASEMNLLQALFEEFELKKYIMRVDSKWNYKKMAEYKENLDDK